MEADVPPLQKLQEVFVLTTAGFQRAFPQFSRRGALDAVKEIAGAVRSRFQFALVMSLRRHRTSRL